MPDFKHKATDAGYTVIAPAMPNADAPTIASWVATLADIVSTPDGNTHLVGHSIGCQTILRYLGGLPEFSRVGHVVLVAPWFNLTNLEAGEEPIAREWLETPIDTDAVRRFTEDITAIFSDDDSVVPLSDAELFRERLDARVIIEHEKGHFSQDSGVTELPSALEPFGIKYWFRERRATEPGFAFLGL